MKFEPLGTRSRLTLALFDITQQNVLTPDPTPGRIGFNIQTGEIRSRGFEAEAVTNVVEGFDLIATYTKLDVEVTKSTTPATIGKAPIVTPEELASIFADYTFQAGPLAGFGFGAGARYVGESYMDNVNLISNDAYTVADAALHYTYDDVTVGAQRQQPVQPRGDDLHHGGRLPVHQPADRHQHGALSLVAVVGKQCLRWTPNNSGK